MEVQEKTGSGSKAESDSDRIRRVLSNTDKYPEHSSIYYYNESLEDGRGSRVLCYNSLSGRKIRETRGRRGYKRPLILDYKDSDLPDRWEAELHVHIAHTHYSGTERASFDHTSIVRAVIKDSCHMRDKILSAMKSSINLNLCGLLSGVERVYGPEGREIVKQLTGGFCQSVMDDARAGEYRASKRMKYSFPTDHREVAKNTQLVSTPSSSVCLFPALK